MKNSLLQRCICALIVCMAAISSGASNDINQDLFRAVRDGDSARIKKLLASGADVNARDANESTPLMYAAQYSTADCMKLLLEKAANPNAANRFGSTALVWGARDAAKVRLLIAAGAKVNARARSGRTALMVGSSYGGAGEAVRAMIEAGADVRALDSQGNGAVVAAAEIGDAAVLKILLDNGGDVNERSATGSALMRASTFENEDCVRLLIAKGADVNWQSPIRPPVKAGQQDNGELTALHMAAQTGNAEIVRILLDAGANHEIRDMRGMTALLLAVTAESQNAETVRLLLSRGARTDVVANDGRSALDWAWRWGETPIVKLLQDAGAKGGPKPENTSLSASAERSAGRDPRAAVGKSVALLQSSSIQFFEKSGCSSCHHQYAAAQVVSLARERGFAVNDRLATQSLKETMAVWEPRRELMLQRTGGGGSPATTTALGSALADQNVPQSPLTDALVHEIAGCQRLDGSWHAPLNRPPIASNITDTAQAIRTLSVYAPPARKPELDRQIDRARSWLLAASPEVTQDFVMRLLGLKWSGLAPSELANAATELVKLQHSDGGWGQRSGFPSDAYATGQALFALHEAGGLSTKDRAYERGIQYLLGTQLDDGSWLVKSRSVKFQPYFESGFPHGPDQWISASGTAWAASALALACDPKPMAAQALR